MRDDPQYFTKQIPTAPDTFEHVVEQFFKIYVAKKGLRTAKIMRQRVDKHLVPAFKDREFASIRRKDLIAVLDQIEEAHGASMHDAILATFRSIVTFFASRDEDYRSPLGPNMKRYGGKRAWANTLNLVGWDAKKVVSAIFVPLGTLVITGIANGFTPFSTIISLVIGAALLVPLLFVWGIIQAQADMYRDLANQKSQPAVAAAPETNYLATPKPDYEKWRHVENLDLSTAAQLWEGQRPGMGLAGAVKETFAMLCGAIQKGDLKFIAAGSLHMSQDTARQLEQKNPTTSTKVTRAGLKAFANKYGYDPEFLQDPTPVPTSQSPAATGQ